MELSQKLKNSILNTLILRNLSVGRFELFELAERRRGLHRLERCEKFGSEITVALTQVAYSYLSVPLSFK